MPPFLASRLAVTSWLLFFEPVFRIEQCGFRVVATTLDGYSANRHFIQLVAADATGVKHKMANPSAPDREIFSLTLPT